MADDDYGKRGEEWLVSLQANDWGRAIAIGRLLAERDALKHDIERSVAASSELATALAVAEAERDRLRRALEDVAPRWHWAAHVLTDPTLYAEPSEQP